MRLLRTRRPALPGCLLSALLAVALPLRAQQAGSDGRTLHWREFAVSARLDAAGRLHVRERQAMVFDGAWNGGERRFDLRPGQRIRLDSLVRIDPRSGARTPLVQGKLKDVDEFRWTGGETLRWRSRDPSDPPFRDREIDYELDYVLWPVLVAGGDGTYQLSHDFAFGQRPGVIEHFALELAIDSAWSAPGGRSLREEAAMLPPGRGYAVHLPLRRVAAGPPAAVAGGPPGPVRAGVVLGALLVPLLVLAALRRRDRELDRVAPLVAPEAVTRPWLDEHVFAHPPEVVGAAWDRSVGAPEVAALLARLVAEGKLTSRVEAERRDPVLHLTRVAPLASFPDHERDLLEGLFFSGRAETDTGAIRRHYRDRGFDPAALIRRALVARLDALPGRGRRSRPWAAAIVVLLAGALTAITGAANGLAVALVGSALALAVTVLAGTFAALLSRRVASRVAPAVGVILPLAAGGAALAIFAAGYPGGEEFRFYRPGTLLLLGLLVELAGAGLLAAALSRPAETVERLAFRRRLASARRYFQAELDRPQPRLEDAWFPYLLAFGLGGHVDRWFRSFGAPARDAVPGVVVLAGGAPSGGHAGGGWTGGGAHFGGGDFGGGGAGGTWSVAAAGLAGGVSAPSSGGGGGGGGAASGGGGGGGW